MDMTNSNRFNEIFTRIIFFSVFLWFAFRNLCIMNDAGITSVSAFQDYFLGLNDSEIDTIVGYFVFYSFIPIWLVVILSTFWRSGIEWVDFIVITIIDSIFVLRTILLTIVESNMELDSVYVAAKGAIVFLKAVFGALINTFVLHFYGVTGFVQLLTVLISVVVAFGVLSFLFGGGEFFIEVIGNILMYSFGVISVLVIAVFLPGMIIFLSSEGYFYLCNLLNVAPGFVILFMVILSVALAYIMSKIWIERGKDHVKIIDPDFFANTMDVIKANDKKGIWISCILLVVTIIMVNTGRLGEISDIFKVLIDNDMLLAKETHDVISDDSLVLKNFTVFCISMIISILVDYFEEMFHKEENSLFKSITDVCINLIIQVILLPPLAGFVYSKVSKYDIPTSEVLRERLGLSDGKVTIVFILAAIMLILFNILFAVGGVLYAIYMGICMFGFSLSASFLNGIGITGGWVFLLVIYLISRLLHILNNSTYESAEKEI